jgi:hypothetical protein
MNKVAKGYLFPISFAIFVLTSFAGQANAQGSRKPFATIFERTGCMFSTESRLPKKCSFIDELLDDTSHRV